VNLVDESSGEQPVPGDVAGEENDVAVSIVTLLCEPGVDVGSRYGGRRGVPGVVHRWCVGVGDDRLWKSVVGTAERPVGVAECGVGRIERCVGDVGLETAEHLERGRAEEHQVGLLDPFEVVTIECGVHVECTTPVNRPRDGTTT
jgi:hypothetical protein